MFIKLYLIALPIFILMDLAWLGFLAKDFYKTQIGFLIKGDVNWFAAGAFYLIFMAGLVFFVILPAVTEQSLMRAILYGAFFGLVTYATYDLTNMATIENWSLTVTLVDLAWGAFIGAMVSGLTYSIGTSL